MPWADHLAAAEIELRAALQLDPSDAAIRERLGEIQNMAALSPQDRRSVPQLAASQAVRPRPGTRNFSYRGDIRGAYELVAQQFGVTAQFDSALAAKTIRFVLPDADFSAAMTALSVSSGTFWVSLNDGTFFVAEDTPRSARNLPR